MLSFSVCILTNNGKAVRATAQDFAAHRTYTEPNTGITFYTSYETNGNITGDGELSTVSWGGFTFGIALPATASTVDTHEYIGLIVSPRDCSLLLLLLTLFRSALLPLVRVVGAVLYMATTNQQAC